MELQWHLRLESYYIRFFKKYNFLPRPWAHDMKLECLTQNRVCPTWILSHVKADR